jgi:hypothetical protein
MLRRILLACGVWLALIVGVHAQGSMGNTTGLVLTTCGSPVVAFQAGNPGPFTVDVNGKLCTNATGGGGGAVTVADGADVTQGAKADAVCGTATGTCSEVALIKFLNQTNVSILSAVQGPIPAGAAIIGALVANQSVNVAQIGGNATAVGSGVQATALRTTIATDSPGVITLGPATIANSVPVVQSSQYPGNATAAANPVTGNGTGTTGAVVGTLAGVASKTTFICGFSVDAIGGTASVGPITVAGLVGSSMVFQMSSSATGAFREKTFSPCIPASAANTAITTTTTAAAGATAVDVNSWGYQL